MALALGVAALLSACPDRWDPSHPPGVSHGVPTTGAEVERVASDDPSGERAVAIASGDEVVRGELADGDHVLSVDGTLYDEYALEVPEGASLVVHMSSDDFEPYLHLIGPDGRQVVHRGAPEGESAHAAELVVVVPDAGRYSIYANALEASMRGVYELRVVVEAPPRPSGR